MNNTQFFLPEKCKVGLQHREGTYTGKLGYIIYHDGKIWRKENSWNGWRHKEGQEYGYWDREAREHKKTKLTGVEPIEFDNTPTEGFVLNKKVGGGNHGWNNRQTYSRVYDPRGWEFEITVQNLLYILQECNSYKGKGLEGEFIYAWDGKDLVLLPVSSPDYIACKSYTDLQSVKFNSRKDLHEGFTYLTNKQDEFIYLGRYVVCMDGYSNKTQAEWDFDPRYRNPKDKLFEKRHVFIHKNEKDYARYEFLNGFARIKKKITEECHPDFPELVDNFLKSEYASEADYLVSEKLTEEDIDNLKPDWGDHAVYPLGKVEIISGNKTLVRYNKEDNTYESYFYPRSGHDTYWNRHNGSSRTVIETFTEAELKQKFGTLKRVYKNGFKQAI